MSDESLLVDVDDQGVARVTLNRPDKHNAFDDRLIARMHTALDDLASRDDVRLVVLGANGRSFSAGADLNWMRHMAETDYKGNLEDARALAAMLERLNTMPLPIIGRIHGAAFGGAVGLVACCDIVVASAAARFALSEVKLGLVPATISPYVVRAMGERAARRYFITGEPIDAERACELGLVSEVVAEGALDERVNHFIGLLSGNGPGAITAAKALVAEVAGRPIDAALREKTSALIARLRVSAEGQEGVAAFFDKRRPAWKTWRRGGY